MHVLAGPGEGAEGTYLVNREPCDLKRAVEKIEAALLACPVTPFFGSATHLEHRALSERLRALGSALHPELVMIDGWYRVEVWAPEAQRRCLLLDTEVELFEGPQRLRTRWPTFEDAVSAIRRFCEDGASFEDTARDSVRG